VPGAGSLTVSPSDAMAAGAWAQRSGGPSNPQQLNRYSYVLNNPVRNVDPTGHCLGPVLVWCAVVVGEFVADVVIPAVVGSFLIAEAVEVGQQLGQAHAADAKDDNKDADIPTVVIPADKYPDAAKHVEDAQAAGHPDVLTLDRKNADERRKASLSGIPVVPGMNRDEYPPAVFKEGGAGASVRHIPSSDNKGAGAHMGQQLRQYPDGTRVRVKSSGQLK